MYYKAELVLTPRQLFMSLDCGLSCDVSTHMLRKSEQKVITKAVNACSRYQL